jgi:outer membrane protein assembly factor BamD (BamD/ComL family)
MSVSAIGSSSSSYQVQAQQSQDYFQQLAQSLNSGNLQGAQTAFAALQQKAQGSQTAQAGASATNPISTDISALGTALQSGNLTAAQQAFAKLQSDGKAAHGHHHHHGGGQESTQSATDPTSTATGGSLNLSA